MKLKPKRNKLYRPKPLNQRTLHMAEMYRILEPLDLIKTALLRGSLNANTVIDRLHDNMKYNDYVLLIYLHEYTFLVQELIKDTTRDIIKYSHRIRQIIEKYFDKVLSLIHDNTIPTDMPIGRIGALKLIWYIDNSRLLWKCITIGQYAKAIVNVKTLHMTYCRLHNLKMLTFIDDSAEVEALNRGDDINAGARVLANKLGIEL